MANAIASLRSRLLGLFRRLQAALVGTLLIAGVAFACRDGAGRVPDPGTVANDDSSPGSGVVVASQVLDVWLPRPWNDEAQRRAKQPSAKAETQGGFTDAVPGSPVLYAVSILGRQADGGSVAITYLRGPELTADTAGEFHNVLDAAAGLRSARPGLDCSRAAVHIIPAVSTRQELLQAIEKARATGAPTR